MGISELKECMASVEEALSSVRELIVKIDEAEKESFDNVWIEPSVASKMLDCTVQTIHNRGNSGMLQFKTKDKCVRKRVYSLESINNFKKRYNNYL